MYYIAGGFDGYDSSARAEVLAWSDEQQEWVEKGQLQVARYEHGTTTIQMDEEMTAYCG